MIERSQQEQKDAANTQQWQADQLREARHLNVITGVGAGFSVISLLILIFSISLNKRSLDLAKQATDTATAQAKTSQAEYRSSQRPWITLDLTATKLSLQNNIASIEIGFRSDNVGHSVANNVYVRPILVTERMETGKECDLAATAALENRSTPSAMASGIGIGIFPTQSYHGDFPAFIPAVDIARALEYRKDGLVLKLIGCASYTSPADLEPHYTRISYLITHHGVDNVLFVPNSGVVDVDLRMDMNGIYAK